METKPATSTGPKTKVTCYSDGEGAFMQGSQELRGRLFRPLLAGLARLGLTPNHLTLLSLLTGLAFCPLFLWSSKAVAFGLLLAHVLLDGLDGPLARYLRTASNQGSFTDTTADQVVVAFSTVTLIHAGQAGAWAGGLYVFFYSMVVIFAMVRNALAVPYSWLVRPRFLVYAWFPVEVYLWPGSLNILLWIVTLLLAVKMLTGFIQIRRRL
jgi:phosphatidylglycerophosphate synthase